MIMMWGGGEGGRGGRGGVCIRPSQIIIKIYCAIFYYEIYSRRKKQDKTQTKLKLAVSTATVCELKIIILLSPSENEFLVVVYVRGIVVNSA